MSNEKCIVISAHGTNGYMPATPDYVVVRDAENLLERLIGLQKIVIDNDLSELRVYAGANWGPGNVEEELRLTCGELVVSNRSFWFVDQPKNVDGHVESVIIDIEDLSEALKTDKQIYFMGHRPEDLQAAYEESLELHVNDTDGVSANYIIGDWNHIFDGEKSERPVRIVIDAASQKLIKMEVLSDRSRSDSYRLATQIELDDVEDSIVNANAEVFVDPSEFGLEFAENLPSWAVSKDGGGA